MANPETRPENMLPIMIMLGIMFLGICIAMHLFSRARFKKRTNAFTAGARAAAQRRSHRGPGNSQRLGSHCPPYMLPPPSIKQKPAPIPKVSNDLNAQV